MRIITAFLQPYALPLRQPWRTARGRLTLRRGWLLGLESETGLLGWGDCAPLAGTGTEAPTEARRALAALLPRLHGLDIDPALRRLAALPPAARCAAQTALLDLRARDRGISLARLLGAGHCEQLRLNAACGALGPEAMRRVAAAARAGYRTVKLKVGLAAPREEARLLEQIARDHPGIGLRLDANGAWEPPQARAFCNALAGLAVESLEEPLRKPEYARLEALQACCPFPLALDESLAGLDPEHFGTAFPVRRLVLKPTPLGGPLATLRWAEKAAAGGVGVVLTSTLESALGIAAVAQTAAAISPEAVHGLATGDWFQRDLAAPPVISRGCLRLPREAGIGATLLTEAARGAD
ncbi:MAG: o-succinylbenzoate synthase [Candidatus Sedimenticola endophacoides]